tara:strand:+ start:1708 stop:2031 length:324 start_codon:yes stop_codon:yes gene_type:complete
MQDKSLINTKKLVSSLLSDMQIEIEKKENELSELKIKSGTVKNLISLSKNINHFLPIVELLKSNKKHKVKQCAFCNAVLISIKNRKYCNNSCKVMKLRSRGNIKNET